MSTNATRGTAAPETTEKNTNSWLALLLAGGFEVGYALSVNGSEGFTNLTW